MEAHKTGTRSDKEIVISLAITGRYRHKLEVRSHNGFGSILYLKNISILCNN